MENERIITNIPSGKTYVPGITIAGKYMEKYGFGYGTPVTVLAEENVIIIIKNRDPKHSANDTGTKKVN